MNSEASSSRSWSRAFGDNLPKATPPETIHRARSSLFTPRLLLTAALVLCASCSSGSTGATNPALQSLTLTPSGWQADAVVGQSVVLQTKVADASGAPVSGIVLNYTASDTTVLRVHNEGGDEATVTALRPGTVQLTVGLASSESGTETAPSVSVQVTVRLAGVAIDGSGKPLVLTSVGDSAVVQGRGLDVAGNTVAGVSLEWSVAGSGVASVTPYAGGDSASVVAVGAGTDTVKATASLCVTGCGATRVVEVRQAVASITLTPDSAAIMAGDSAVFTAEAYDASVAPVVGAPIRWTIGDRTLATVDSSGVVHAWHTGVTQVIAFDGLVHAAATLQVEPGPATQLVFTTQPSTTPTGTALSPAVAVSEKDAYGNVARGSTDSVTVALGTNPSGATLAGTTTEAAASGVATFANLSLAKAGTGYTLVATSASGLPSVTSTPFDIYHAWVAYVASSGANAVSVIDVASGTVTKTIGAGLLPFDLAFTPDGKQAYVVNGNDRTVSVIDVASGSLTKTITVGLAPRGVAITPNGKKAYVTIGSTSSVAVIDVASGTVKKTLTGFASEAYGVAVTPDGTKAYVTDYGSGEVSVIDVAADTVFTKTIAVGGPYPDAIAITPDGTKAYVVNLVTNTISVIDMASGTVKKTMTAGNNAHSIAITPDGTKAYVPDAASGAVSVIDVATDAVTNTIAVGNTPYGIAFTPDGKTAYVTNLGSSTVSVIDVASGTVTKTITAGLVVPRAVAIH